MTALTAAFSASLASCTIPCARFASGSSQVEIGGHTSHSATLTATRRLTGKLRASIAKRHAFLSFDCKEQNRDEENREQDVQLEQPLHFICFAMTMKINYLKKHIGLNLI